MHVEYKNDVHGLCLCHHFDVTRPLRAFELLETNQKE